MKKIAIVDPSSYALPYDYFYIKALSKFYFIDFYCSSSNYNSDMLYKISDIKGVNVFQYRVSGVNRITGVSNLLLMYKDIFLNAKRYSSINIQWSIIYFFDVFFYALIKNKLVFTFHNAKPHTEHRNTYFPNHVYSRLSKRNIFVSQYTFKTFENDYGFCSEKNFILPHGCMPLTDNANEVIFKPNSTPEIGVDKKIIFWGNVKGYKGLDFIVELVDDFRKGKFFLEVYGKYDNDLVYLHDKILDSNFISKNEYMDLNEVVDILTKDNTVLVLPYKNASQSGIMYNCLAHGIPFVSSRVGESARFLQENKLGELVFDYGNKESLFKALNYYFDNKSDIMSTLLKLKGNYSWVYSKHLLQRIFE